MIALQRLLQQVNVVRAHSPVYMATVNLVLCIAQEVGNALQTQGLLEEKDWEEVQNSLREPAAFTPDLVQLKQLQHQVCALQC